jgi:hypothetical protein
MISSSISSICCLKSRIRLSIVCKIKYFREGKESILNAGDSLPTPDQSGGLVGTLGHGGLDFGVGECKSNSQLDTFNNQDGCFTVR